MKQMSPFKPLPPCVPSEASPSVDELYSVAHKTLNNLVTNWTPFFNKKDLEILKKLSKQENLIIIRPDKGKGVVILNKTDYIQKVETILEDNSKFRFLGEPDFSTIFRSEDKITRFLRSLLDQKVINNDTYQDLLTTGGSYGIMYGLPKIHKEGIPIRPILTSYDTPNYKLANYLVPLLTEFSSNSYTLKNSLEFKERILCQDSDLFMGSLDVEALFTNIPVEETIQIILSKIFTDNDTLFHGFNYDNFKKLLTLAVQDTAFIFNGKAYVQADGMAMGSPLGPVLANIFMCELEERLLDNCPLAYHPLFYCRYVDDAFILFKDKYRADLFLHNANLAHPNIKFTID
ncbi:uncharacterized protein LOC135216468 [Macrobrachium nipponense]|uniref:uncharacterized protein LOC135216468 n=1 Tax=Macrobrachium nipponense TaxID=159736 RepID=UPI0030C7D8D0